MHLAVPTRCDTPEWLDEPGRVLEDLPANLRDIRLFNRRFGGTAIALRRLRPLLAGSDTVRLLDVATGSGDIPAAIVGWASRQGVTVHATGLDISSAVLSEAARTHGTRQVSLVEGDARSLPWPDRSFDIVTCFLALHHFPPREAVRVLTEMWRVASSSLVVADLGRSYAAYLGTWLATRTLTRNRVTRHDGPLSVLRAYTASELAEIAAAAGLKNVTHYRHHPFRLALTASRELPSD